VRVLAYIACFFFLASSSSAEYASTEILVIPWGNGPNQLKISPEAYETGNTLADSSDDVTFPGDGPDFCFVDRNENLYFTSYGFSQFKGFDPTGRLIFDYSKDEPAHNDELFRACPIKVYIDSLCHIYILSGPNVDFVTMIDTTGHLLSRLHPYGENSGVFISNIYFNSNDAISFRLRDGTYHTYSGGLFSTGGDMSWRALDRLYYFAFSNDPATYKVEKLKDPDINGNVTVLLQKTYSSNGADIWYSEFLGVDCQMYLHLFIQQADPMRRRIVIFDSNLNQVDEVVLDQSINMFNRTMTPFMRPSDGNIYEFRCLDDGLHVIRWSRE